MNTGTRYKYALIDMSYLLSRNMFAIVKGKGIGEFVAGDFIKSTIQSVNKLSRDIGITADKYILLCDRWDSELGGYYRTSILKGDYKSSREFMTDEILAELKCNPDIDEKTIKKAEIKLYTNNTKRLAKYSMIQDLKYVGIPCFGVEGWEFDDLAWLATCMLYGQDNGKPSIIITKDSDLQYSTSPQMDYFKMPVGGSEPRIITYDEMYNTIPEHLKNSGLSLYNYKCMLDSLGDGHNDMTKTKKRGADSIDAITRILQGDFSKVANEELFKKQMHTFDLSHFPRLEEAKDIIMNQMPFAGKLGSIVDFRNFCQKHGVTGVTDKYYSDFINKFDARLFTEL